MSDKATLTLLQIDLQNLFYVARGQKIDYEKIWEYFNSRETEFLTKAFVYLIRSNDFDSSKFEDKLVKIGYSIREKNAVKTYRGNKTFYRQADHSVNIAIEALERIDTYQKLILMSNNGCLADLCKYMRSKGKKIEIWNFKDSFNPQLEQYADKLYFFDETFFFKKPKISVFGFNLNDVGNRTE